MKKEMIKKWNPVVATLALLSIGSPAFAQEANAVLDNLTVVGATEAPDMNATANTSAPAQNQVPIPRQSKSQILRSLEAQILPAQAIVNPQTETQGKVYIPPSDVAYYGGWMRPSPPSMEGIPVGNIPSYVPDNFAVGAYEGPEIVKLLAKAEDECGDEPMGARITCYEQYITTILTVSGQLDDQLLLRLTLNRAVDVVHHVMPFAGYNSDAIAQLIVNFYETMFNEAIAFTNNKAALCSNLDDDYSVDKKTKTLHMDEMDTSELKVSVAEFGRIFAEQMYRIAQSSNLSESAKAVLLMRATGYLGWDLASDLRWREPAIRQVMIDVYNLQASREYKVMLAAMKAGHEPESKTLKQYQYRFWKIKQELGPQLQRAGVAATPAEPHAHDVP